MKTSGNSNGGYDKEDVHGNKDMHRSILLITYNRYDLLNQTLHHILETMKGNGGDVLFENFVIMQQLCTTDHKMNQKIRRLIQKFIRNGKKSFKEKLSRNITFHHITTPSIPMTHMSQKYGSAANIMNNVLQGIHHIMDNIYGNNLNGALDYLLVLEDDIEISNDFFTFIQKCEEEMQKTKDISLATATYFLRDQHPSYDWKRDRPMKYKSRHNSEFIHQLNPYILEKVEFIESWVEFKVLAWYAPRNALQLIRQQFDRILNIAKAYNYDYFDPHLIQALPHCDQCGFHYDRWIEKIFEHTKFISSQYPRVNHIGIHGLSYRSEDSAESHTYPLNPFRVKHAREFILRDIASSTSWIKKLSSRVLNWFPFLSLSCPDQIRCFNQENVSCGTLAFGTCFRMWKGCIPCDGRPLEQLGKRCDAEFPACCTRKQNGKEKQETCKAHSSLF